jgi:hypothetical protein
MCYDTGGWFIAFQLTGWFRGYCTWYKLGGTSLLRHNWVVLVSNWEALVSNWEVQYRETLSVPPGAICTNRESSLISSHCATLANYKTYRDWGNIAIHRAVFRHTPAISPLGKARYIAENRAESRGIDTRTYKNTIQTFITVSSLIALRIRVPCRGYLSSNVVVIWIQEDRDLTLSRNVNIARYIAL